MDSIGDSAKLALQYAAENRRNEIALFWSRSLYFGGFISVLLTAYGASFGSGHKTLAFVAACFGFLTNLSWTLANRSSKYWQSVWERKTEDAENGVLSKPTFPRSSNPEVTERWLWGAKKYSPSKLVIALSDFSMIGWIILGMGVIGSRLIECFPSLQIAAVVMANFLAICLTGLATVAILAWCRAGDPLSRRDVCAALRWQPTKLRQWMRSL